ncbi:hypothetical protein FA95DRAFT_371722 [Auriscalpium vulgare]|uniref:Uncharacterized protein n=1 Tax=Auriscalpium vulgare TaxID=40419 RepID=A0ACB8RII5_9AGAM|nr:hypothetical protein FA95DRAFT_371722 [Auriscalpium vulgare]
MHHSLSHNPGALAGLIVGLSLALLTSILLGYLFHKRRVTRRLEGAAVVGRVPLAADEMEEMGPGPGGGMVTQPYEYYEGRSGDGLLSEDSHGQALHAGPSSGESALSLGQPMGTSVGHGMAPMPLGALDPRRTSSSAGHGYQSSAGHDASSPSQSHSNVHRMSARSSLYGGIPSGLISPESEGGSLAYGVHSLDGHTSPPPPVPARARASTVGSPVPPPSAFFGPPRPQLDRAQSERRSGRAFLRRSLKWRLRGGGPATGSSSDIEASAGSGSGSGSSAIPMSTFFAGSSSSGRSPLVPPPQISVPLPESEPAHMDAEEEEEDSAPVGLLHPRLAGGLAGRSVGTLSLRDEVDYSRPLAVVRARSYVNSVRWLTVVGLGGCDSGCTAKRRLGRRRARARTAMVSH